MIAQRRSSTRRSTRRAHSRRVERRGTARSLLFLGTVREVNDGRAVTGIDYSAYEAMAERELARSSTRRPSSSDVADVVVEHRLGDAGARRGERRDRRRARAPRRGATTLSRYVIEELKHRVPIWKREHYADGTREWVDPTRPRERGSAARERRSATSSGAASSICASRSPIAATSAACTACRWKGCRGCRRADILSYEEIAEVVRQLAPLGCAGCGSPAASRRSGRDLDDARPSCSARSPEIEDIALSTNGVRLPRAGARRSREAGLDRVNMCADSLRPDRIAAIARRNLGFDPIVAATAAQDAGLAPIKINVVVMRGINDDEVEDFARLTLDHPWHVRFIELMPVGDMRELTWEHVVPSDEVLARIATRRRARAGRRSGARQRSRAVLPARRRARAPSA